MYCITQTNDVRCKIGEQKKYLKNIIINVL